MIRFVSIMNDCIVEPMHDKVVNEHLEESVKHSRVDTMSQRKEVQE